MPTLTMWASGPPGHLPMSLQKGSGLQPEAEALTQGTCLFPGASGWESVLFPFQNFLFSTVPACEHTPEDTTSPARMCPDNAVPRVLERT